MERLRGRQIERQGVLPASTTLNLIHTSSFLFSFPTLFLIPLSCHFPITHFLFTHHSHTILLTPFIRGQKEGLRKKWVIRKKQKRGMRKRVGKEMGDEEWEGGWGWWKMMEKSKRSRRRRVDKEGGIKEEVEGAGEWGGGVRKWGWQSRINKLCMYVSKALKEAHL